LGIREAEADRAVEDFPQHRRVDYVGPSRSSLLKTFDLARVLMHDVYDTFYPALAIEHRASAFLTTDADSRGLCPEVRVVHKNPVLEDILAQFGAVRGR
jgi:predicted nucleic acid-binding protein